jgi:dihydroxyacetone kinase-like predicted kinase
MSVGTELVAAGSVIALRDRKIIAFGSEESEVAWRAISESMGSSAELITLVTGAQVSGELVEEISSRINQSFPSIEVTTYSGGQAWYPLLIGIE